MPPTTDCREIARRILAGENRDPGRDRRRRAGTSVARGSGSRHRDGSPSRNRGTAMTSASGPSRSRGAVATSASTEERNGTVRSPAELVACRIESRSRNRVERQSEGAIGKDVRNAPEDGDKDRDKNSTESSASPGSRRKNGDPGASRRQRPIHSGGHTHSAANGTVEARDETRAHSTRATARDRRRELRRRIDPAVGSSTGRRDADRSEGTGPTRRTVNRAGTTRSAEETRAVTGTQPAI